MSSLVSTTCTGSAVGDSESDADGDLVPSVGDGSSVPPTETGAFDGLPTPSVGIVVGMKVGVFEFMTDGSNDGEFDGGSDDGEDEDGSYDGKGDDGSDDGTDDNGSDDGTDDGMSVGSTLG